MTNSPASSYPWRFFRAGGFDQVKLETGADLMNLDQLDQKLWVALACPINGIEFDIKTAALIDTDKDGRIRTPELIAAVKWAGSMLKNPDTLVQGGDSLPLAAISDSQPGGAQILASAKQILVNLGKGDTTAISLADASDANKIFANTTFNGDGIIIPESAADEATKAIINEIATCLGTVNDRSAKPGIDQTKADTFFAECAAFDAWMKLAETDVANIMPAREATVTASAAVKAIKGKVDDYFGRCRLVAFDPRTIALLNRKEEEYLAIAVKELSINAAEIKDFPLAQVAAEKPLPLKGTVNPAHAAAIATLNSDAVKPLLGGERLELTEAEWAALQARLAAFDTWNAAKAGAIVEKLGITRIREILAGRAKDNINALIAKDKALEPEANAIESVEKLIRYVRDLHKLCINFVNFKDLYSGEAPAVFQAGTLYLDQRSCTLCLTVDDAARHASMAGLAGAYLAYCDCVRKGTGEKLNIVAVFSQGGDENLMLGRNGIFYDRKGRDYDATIAKILPNPISMRQAFWSPYKKLVRMIEEQVAKRAAAADADADKQLAAAAAAANANPAAPGAPAPAAKPAFDPSVIALLSVALGSLAAAFATILVYLGKFEGWQLPFVAIAIMLIISGPSLILAFMKLRKRNLGPILDANGWAVNAKAKINVPFGTSLTGIAKLPKGSSVDVSDRYAEKSAAWPKVLIVVLILWWIYGIMSGTGLLYWLTKDWEKPLGKPPTELKAKAGDSKTTVVTVTEGTKPATNAPAK